MSAAPSDEASEASEAADFEDLLGSGALLKRTLHEGTGRKPDHGQACWVSYTSYIWDPSTNARGDVVQEVERAEVVIGDDDFGM